MIIIKIIIFLFLIFIILPVAVLRYIEPRTLFYPTKNIEVFPDRLGLKYQNVFFNAGKLKLNGWFVPAQNARYTILFCHGNAGNIGHRVEKLKFFNALGCNIFIFDYRGYGASQGVPSEKGFYQDMEAAYKYLLGEGIAADRIIGYGESIGGAVVVELAAKEKMRAIILDSTFSSVRDMIRVAYPGVPYWVFASRFDSLSKIKSIAIPKLIIHSINDEIVPYHLGQKLFAAASAPKAFLQVRGGHNSNFYESTELLGKGIGDFLNKL